MITQEIPGIDSRYRATDTGHIISYMGKAPRILASGLSTSKLYRTVSILREDGTRVNKDVHRMVCEAFHGLPPAPKMQASHFDGNSHDNRPTNLMWETPSENLSRKKLHGTHDSGYSNSRSVMTPEKVETVLKMRQAGAIHRDIAEALNVSRTTISRILNNQRYTNE